MPADEVKRLAALRSLFVLDTPHEERFDRITRLATQLFGVPIALISLVEEDRQWFKASEGLSCRETPREDSICAHAILNPSATMVVPDAQLDPRFAGNRLVTGEPHIRFYAGHPLVTADGFPLGTLCIIDREPRDLSPEQQSTLRDLARVAEAELTTAELNRALAQLRTGEEKLRRAEENYRSIFENVAEGIFQIDSEGRFINANPAVARIYGYESVAELTEKVVGFGRACQTDPTRRTALLDDLSSASRVTNFESEIFRADGTVAWISESIHAVRAPTGECLYYEGTVHDITGQRYAAAAQAQARDEAVKSAEIKSDFLSTMSHEIRTPMHGIIGMTGLLLNTALNPEQEELVRLIASCGDNLLSLINNALDFSKIEAGCLELDNQPFALRPCLKEVIDLLSVQASNKNLTLACEVDPRIPEVLVSDLTRVRQILFNLISNSMKFTPPGGRVDVAVTGHQLNETVENHGHVGAIDPWMFHFTVRDTGEGIPEEKLHRLFRPFSQVDATISRKHGGTGLGLAICHRLCEMLGGAIWLESELGTGSNFEFTVKAAAVPGAVDPQSADLPPPAAAAPAIPPPKPEPVAEAPMRPLKILLAEDNPVNQRVALGLLRQIGYTASTVWNGLDAIQALQKEPYDVVLMDVQMPEMDGLEATREIRRLWPDGPRRPYIIAMTANAMTGDREKCLDAGMDEYVSKPVKANRLKSALEQCSDLREAVAAIHFTDHTMEPATLNRDSLEALKSLQAEGDDGFLKEMVDLFLTDTPLRLNDMESALQEGQQQDFVRAVHSIKGASANFGADDLHALCAEIEQMGRTGQLDEAGARIEQVHSEFERVRMALLAEV